MTRHHAVIPTILLALAMLVPAAHAQPQEQHEPSPRADATTPDETLFPDTPVGRAARLWFDAIRSGEQAPVEAMIRERFDTAFLEQIPLPQHLTMHMRLARAGISLPHSIASQNDHEITYYLRDGGVWGQLRIAVSRDEPHGITNVAVRPSAGPPELQGRPKTMKAFRDETVEFLDALRDKGRFDGAVFIGPVNPVDGDDPNNGLAWVAPDARRDIPIEFVLDAIKLAVPLSVVHNTWDERQTPADPLAAPISGSQLEERALLEEIELTRAGGTPEQLAKALDQARRARHQQYRDLADSIFAGDSPARLEFQRGLVHALVFDPLWMTDCEVPFGAEGRMNPADLTRFGRGLINHEYIRPRLLTDVTTGVGPDLDRSPRIVRRNAMAGFEERIDDNGVRSFSLRHAGDDTHVLLRCYPRAGCIIVIVAPDEKTLNLIDRRIFNRLPGLEPAEDADDAP